MTKTIDTENVRSRIREAMHQLDSTFIQRTDAVRCIALAELSGANWILVADPGTGKTALARCWFSHITDGSFFTTLCGSFATEDKIFGPVDIEGFKAGRWGRVLNNRLAAVTHAFLDELMKSNEGTLNGMLTALNERVYEGARIPLRSCGAATNWPEIKARTENVAALWDRILLRCPVSEVVGEEAEVALLEAAEKVEAYEPVCYFSVDELDAARASVREVELGNGIRKMLAKVRARLAKDKINNSARRLAQLQVVLRANAWLDGREEVTLEDFEALKFGLWHDKEHVAVVSTVLDTVDVETVQKCIQAIDQAMSEYSRIKSLSPARRLEEAPRVLKVMRESARAVQNELKETGATSRGKERVAKAIAGLKARFDELSREIKALE